MTIIRRKLGPTLSYYQFVSDWNSSDRYYFAAGDETTRCSALREARAFRKYIYTMRKISWRTWRQAAHENHKRSRKARIIRTVVEPITCVLDFSEFE